MVRRRGHARIAQKRGGVMAIVDRLVKEQGAALAKKTGFRKPANELMALAGALEQTAALTCQLEPIFRRRLIPSAEDADRFDHTPAPGKKRMLPLQIPPDISKRICELLIELGFERFEGNT